MDFENLVHVYLAVVKLIALINNKYLNLHIKFPFFECASCRKLFSSVLTKLYCKARAAKQGQLVQTSKQEKNSANFASNFFSVPLFSILGSGRKPPTTSSAAAAGICFIGGGSCFSRGFFGVRTGSWCRSCGSFLRGRRKRQQPPTRPGRLQPGGWILLGSCGRSCCCCLQEEGSGLDS